MVVQESAEYKGGDGHSGAENGLRGAGRKSTIIVKASGTAERLSG